MSRKYLSLVLVGALFQMMLLMTPMSVNGQTEKDTQRSEKTKLYVAAVGPGRDARVSVKLRQGKKLKGYISQAGEDSFVLTDSKTGSTTSIAYADVAKVQRNQGASIGKGILIGIGAAVTALFVIVLIVAVQHR